MTSSATKLFDFALRAGAEILTSDDPFSTTIEILGRKTVGGSLARVLASQCLGVFGLAVYGISPSVSKILFNEFCVDFVISRLPSHYF